MILLLACCEANHGDSTLSFLTFLRAIEDLCGTAGRLEHQYDIMCRVDLFITPDYIDQLWQNSASLPRQIERYLIIESRRIRIDLNSDCSPLRRHHRQACCRLNN